MRIRKSRIRKESKGSSSTKKLSTVSSADENARKLNNLRRRLKDALKGWRPALFWTLVGVLLSALATVVIERARNLGAEVKLEVCSILVSRKSATSFPECRLVIRTENERTQFRTVVLKSLSLLDGSIVCPLAGNTRTIEIAPRSPSLDTIQFSGPMLDKFLTTPQGPEVSNFVLLGEIPQDSRSITIRLNNKDVDKVTYWQVPVLDTAEVSRLELVPITKVIYMTLIDSTKTREMKVNFSSVYYTSKWEATEIDMTPVKDFMYDSASGTIAFATRIDRVIKKKYGGLYGGTTKSSITKFATFKD